MAEVTAQVPGSFCWPELGTTDQNAAIAFYGGLFGWHVNEIPLGPGETYAMFKLDGKDVAAAYTLRPDQREHGVPPHWMSYVSVLDADHAARKAESLGARVVAAPFDVFDAGRMAVLQDPTGAVFAVWQPKTHFGVGRVDEPGALCWTELLTRDTGRARDFYTRMFDWTYKDSGQEGMPYTEFMNHGTSHAGMMPMPADAAAPPHWIPYFEVIDCDQKAARAKELGAHLYVRPTDIPNVGRFSVIADPQGATFAIVQLNARAA